MSLIRDVLDNQVVDQYQNKIGRVDGIVVELRGDRPPRVTAIEMGAAVLARRLHPRLGAWANGFFARFTDRRSGIVRISYSKVRGVGVDVEVELGPEHEEVRAWEDWVSRRVVGRIPGGG